MAVNVKKKREEKGECSLRMKFSTSHEGWHILAQLKKRIFTQRLWRAAHFDGDL